jgi:hypothetical protein
MFMYSNGNRSMDFMMYFFTSHSPTQASPELGLGLFIPLGLDSRILSLTNSVLFQETFRLEYTVKQPWRWEYMSRNRSVYLELRS